MLLISYIILFPGPSYAQTHTHFEYAFNSIEKRKGEKGAIVTKGGRRMKRAG